MQIYKRLFILIIILITTVGCDQATKSMAQEHLIDAAPASYFYDTVRIAYHENSGAFLSLGGNLSAEAQFWIFTILVSVILVAVATLLFSTLRRAPLAVMVALGLYLGGGVGNLIDRFTNDGRVIDFLNVGIGNLRTGIFNVADMAIMAGFGLMLLSLLNSPQKPAEQRISTFED